MNESENSRFLLIPVDMTPASLFNRLPDRVTGESCSGAAGPSFAGFRLFISLHKKTDDIR